MGYEYIFKEKFIHSVFDHLCRLWICTSRTAALSFGEKNWNSRGTWIRGIAWTKQKAIHLQQLQNTAFRQELSTVQTFFLSEKICGLLITKPGDEAVVTWCWENNPHHLIGMYKSDWLSKT